VIVVDLMCSAEHRFEGWFASPEEFERQNALHMVICPSCGNHEVHRIPSAPHLARASANTAKPTDTPAAELAPNSLAAQLMAALRSRAENSEDVGERFPEEARRIHYGDAEERAIRGVAKLADAYDLLEEGINVLPVPPQKEDLH